MQKHKLLLTVVTTCLILITIGNFLWHVYGYRKDIFAKFDHVYWEKRYFASQWVVHNSTNPIGDDGLYAYVGYAYVQGKDPTLLNAELPPFGKYIVGLFEVTTGAMGTFSMFFGGLSLLMLFVLIKNVFKSSLLASFGVLFFSLDPLFIEQMRAPFLDTMYLTFFLLTSLFFLQKKYILSGIALGLFMSVKSPLLGILVIVAYGMTLLISKRKFISDLGKILLAAFITYLLTYFRIFFLGHRLIYFFQVQKYILHFYSSGAKGVIGAVFPMLFVGQWPTWFGAPQSVEEWSILWAISLIGTVIGFLWLVTLSKKTEGVIFQSLWIICYFAFLVITPIFPRYLLLLLPFMYNLSIWVLLKSISLKYSWVLPS